MNRTVPLLLILVLALALLAAPATGQESASSLEADPATVLTGHDVARPTSGESTIIGVDLTDEGLATYDGGIPGLVATSPAATGEAKLDSSTEAAQRYLAHIDRQIDRLTARARQSVGSAELVYRYDTVIGGAALRVPADQVDRIAQLPGVERVFPVEAHQVDTDNTPDFLGMEGLWDEVGGQEDAGEGVIVGVVDTGIWPEHPSFADDDMPDPPATWTGSGTGEACDFGDSDWNEDDADFTCNNKLIGARTFLTTYDDVSGIDEAEFRSARDADGHGTHTASTAAGNAGVAASIMGSDLGIVSGMAPRAHVAAYRSCAGPTGTCYSPDTAAAINQAVADGVDVINYSIGGGANPYSDMVSLAMLDAFDAGVLVSTSAGNSGPGADTVGHREPWTITVAASTQDRTFQSVVTLTADDDDGSEASFAGASLTGGASGPVVLAEDFAEDPADEDSVFGARQCLEPFAPGTFDADEIVVCERGLIARVQKSANVEAGGAAGLILYNAALEGVATDNHFLPTVHLEYEEADDADAHPHALVEFIRTHEDTGDGVVASFPDAGAASAQGDFMAAFSSRGGSGQGLGISKPDVTAPGVQVLAGHTPVPGWPEEGGGAPGELFQAIGGTSMSAPHVAGVAAVLRQAHPTWSPSQIRSALMLTGLLDGVTKEDATTPVDAFDVGSGGIRPAAAVDVGLTMEETGDRFRELEDRLWESNYPSVYVPTGADRARVSRTVRNESQLPATWTLTTEGLDDVGVTLPDSVSLAAGGTGTFDVEFDLTALDVDDIRFGRIILSRGSDTLHLPVVVQRIEPDVTYDFDCEPTELVVGQQTDCTIAIQNTGPVDREVSVVSRPSEELSLDPASVEGADVAGGRVTWSGDLPGAPPLIDADVEDDTAPYGYLPLALLGIAPTPIGVDEILNFDFPPFVYGGETYTTLGVVSNGYAVAGGGGTSDVSWTPGDLPDEDAPNNVLAPYWTDHNIPEGGGALRVAALSDSETGNSFVVVDWEDVATYSDHAVRNSFQIWIQTNAPDSIWFTYGEVDGPDAASGAVIGAENRVGTSGSTVFSTLTGTGDAPTPTEDTGYVVRVEGSRAEPGDPYVISYSATGVEAGDWESVVEAYSDAYAGTRIETEEGTVEERELTSVVVTPSSATVDVAGTRQFTATASYTDGSDVDVTDEAAWSSSDTDVATVDDSGLTTGAAGGTATITATFGGQSDTATLTVNPADPDPDPDPDPEPLPEGTFRLSGSGRLQTAVEISGDTFADGAAVAVVLARADTFPDALAGTPLAVDRDAPMLLSPTESLHTVTREEILRVLPEGGTVYLLGGESALSPAVQDELDALGYTTVRLSGSTRIETARAVAEELDNPDTLLITTGYDFPDALAAGAAAAEVGGAVLLTTADTPHPALTSYLAANPSARTYAVGGPAARAYPAATAVSGSTREGTAVRVAETFFDDPTVIGFARRDDFPDALAGGAHIGRLGGPLLLTPTGMLHPTPGAYTCANAATLQTAFGYGGASALSADTLAAIAARVDGDGC